MSVERTYHNSVRPRGLAEFIGQPVIVSQVEAMIAGAKRREEPLGHILCTGPKGLGKTSLARVIGAELGVEVLEVDGHALTSPADAVALLASVPAGGVLFVDELHRLPRPVEEAFYKPLEDFEAHITDGKGGARPLKLEPFTCIGATTSSGRISAPLKERFGAELCFDWYTDEDLAKIIQGAAAKLELDITGAGALSLAAHGRGTPRQVVNLLKRTRDYAADVIEEQHVNKALDAMQIGALGLSVKDRAYLECLSGREDRPVGIKALAAMLYEDAATLEYEIEPFLLAQGFIDLGINGRVLTRDGYNYLSGV